MFFLTEPELVHLLKECNDFTVKKNSLGQWQIKFAWRDKADCFIRTKRDSDPRAFKKLDAVYNYLEKCGVQSFRVEI